MWEIWVIVKRFFFLCVCLRADRQTRNQCNYMRVGKKRPDQKRYATTGKNTNPALKLLIFLVSLWNHALANNANIWCSGLVKDSNSPQIFYVSKWTGCMHYHFPSDRDCIHPTGAHNKVPKMHCSVYPHPRGRQPRHSHDQMHQRKSDASLRASAISHSARGVNVLSLRLIKSIIFSSAPRQSSVAFCDYALALDIWYANNSMMPVHTRRSQEMTSRWRESGISHWNAINTMPSTDIKATGRRNGLLDQ